LPFIRQKSLYYFLAGLSLLLYIFFGYYVHRHETTFLLSGYAILFGLYWWSYKIVNEDSVSFWLYASVIFRFVLLFSVPALSDDVYRFIWDGRLLAAGEHPFAHVPSWYLENNVTIPGISLELYQLLNSQHNFTIYPPLAQAIFWTSVVLSPNSIVGSIIIMRTFVLAAEIGSLVLIQKLLKHYNLPARKALLYAMNPLIILELTGNLHFEAFSIFFVLLCVFLLTKEKIFSSAVSFALAVSAKLLPLIFLPAIVNKLWFKKGFVFSAIAGIVTIIFFIPLLSTEFIQGMSSSLGYYFKKFEFNASIYYLVREWGFWKYGYNIIQTVGWKLGVLSGVLILAISFNRWFRPSPTDHRLWSQLMFVLLVYILFTTIAHPWYITPLVAFSVFTRYKFAVLWSLLIFFTYAGYTLAGYQENLWITALEYGAVIGFFIYEKLKSRETSYDTSQL
jgi:alpha-1,6-mannosyltransferase